MIHNDRRFLVAGLVLSVAAHTLLLFGLRHADIGGTLSGGSGANEGVTLELRMVATALADGARPATASHSEARHRRNTPTPKPEPEPASQPKPKPAPAPEPEPTPVPEPEPTPVPEPEPTPVPEPEPTPVPEPEPTPDPEPAPEPEPTPELARQPKRMSDLADPSPGPPERPQAALAPDSETGGTTAPPGGRQSGAAARGDYLKLLFTTLQQHKEYPRRAQLRREQGVVRLAFTLTADGSVRQPTVVQSSGSRSLDRAALRMLDEASPLPAPPARLVDQEIVVPVQYRLR